MPDYTPFLISNLVEGKVTKRDPWLIPSDAFEEMNDCNLKRGRLEKRRGKSLLGQIVKIDTATLNPTLQTNPVMGVYNHLDGDTEELIVFDKARMNTFVDDKVSGVILLSVVDVGGAPNVVRFTVAAGHGISADDIVTITNTTNYDGTYRVEAKAATTFDIESAFVAETMGATSQVNQEQFTDATENKIRIGPTGVGNDQDTQPATGVTINGVTSGATATLAAGGAIADYGLFGSGTAFGTLVFDRGTVTGTFQAGEQLNSSGVLDTGDIYGYALVANSDEAFTGDNTNFFWTAKWTLGGEPKTYITNNNDPLQIYDGAHLSQLSIDIGTAAARAGLNEVTTALLVFIVKERVVLFNVTDNSTGSQVLAPQRARWSGIKQPFVWPTDSFKDAPTADYIVAGGFLGDDLYIWMTGERGGSVWRFVWTGDSVDPFDWQKVSDQDGAIAQMSVTERNNIQRAIGSTQILANNADIVGPIDEKVPDVVLEWNPDSAGFSASADVDEERQILFTYARVETTANADGNKYPDRALVLNYEDNNWAVHGHDIHAIGFSALESDVTWDLDEAWEDIDFSWNASNTVSGFPFTIIGDHDGLLFQLNVSGSDNGAAIQFNAKTARFNPYNKQGRKAKFWKAEFLCDVDADVSFDVEFFLNSDTTKYKTATITTEPVEGSDKTAWYTAFAETTGSFHSLNITNNASSNRPVIHAMRLWFKPAGKVK